jgi:predicted metal-dependent phosphoesterase TrpH
MKLDLHVHSTFSRDGTATPEDIIAFAERSGLDGIAITDHNAIGGSLKAFDLVRRAGFIVIKGVEISAMEGHVLAYGVAEIIPKGLPIAETVEKIHSVGGIAVAAHPKRFPSGMGSEIAKKVKFDAIEVLNGGSSRRDNAQAREIAREKGSPVTAGSDAHELKNVGKSYTIVESASTMEDVLECIRAGRTQSGGRSRSRMEGARYSIETLIEWLRGDFKRL